LSIYPNDTECIRMLSEAGCKRRVIVHCCTVRTVADTMAAGMNRADPGLVTAGALLHDIGRARDHSIMHATVGADMARDLGLPREIVEIIRRHTGAGLDEQDAVEMGLPPGDYIPRTIEEKIVAHADNLVSDDRVVRHAHSVERLVSKGAYRGAERIELLHMELSDLYGRDLDDMVDLLGEHPRLSGPCADLHKR